MVEKAGNQQAACQDCNQTKTKKIHQRKSKVNEKIRHRRPVEAQPKEVHANPKNHVEYNRKLDPVFSHMHIYENGSILANQGLVTGLLQKQK
ncbi:MAG: hypothetical protein M3342_23635 [Bacteroidota bacterium]|nr:hypothetical protein [Bacteroidota bacterium]